MNHIDLTEHVVSYLEADPLPITILAYGKYRFIQVTQYGSLREQFDIEISNNGEMTGVLNAWDEPWSLVATVYDRSNMWTILRMYINEGMSK
jgi:hypothetical protein